MTPLVSILIVNYNGSNVLKNCLKSLKSLTYENWEVILVDNGSQNDEVLKFDKLVKEYEGYFTVRSLHLKNNLGFAGGNNAAYTHAKGKYILLLNNDTTVSPNLLDMMVNRMESDSTIGAMQPKIKLMDKPDYLDNAGMFLNRLGLSEHWGFGERDTDEFDSEKEIFSAKGACLLTLKSLIKDIGLFDETFGSYFEESDFCYRVWMSGHRVIYYPSTFIYHKVGFTSKQMDQIEIMLKATRNRIYSLFKNFSILHLITILLPHILFLFCLSLYYSIKFQFRKAGMILGALSWNLFHLPLLIQTRNHVQSKRKVDDNGFFPIIMKPLNWKQLYTHFKKVEANLDKV